MQTPFLHHSQWPSGAPSSSIWPTRYLLPALPVFRPDTLCLWPLLSQPDTHTAPSNGNQDTSTRQPSGTGGGFRIQTHVRAADRVEKGNTGGRGAGTARGPHGGRHRELVRSHSHCAELMGQVSPHAAPGALTLAATASMLAGTTHSKVLAFFSRE